MSPFKQQTWSHYTSTIHMTEEGYVEIVYETRNDVRYVDSIDKVEDDTIKSINKLDLTLE